VDPFEPGSDVVSRWRCDTEHGDPVDPRTVLQLAIEAHVRFVIHDDHGIPIHWGRKRRLFTGAARDAVRSLSPRCTHPGCRVRTRHCQIDHTTEFSRAGPTDPGNGNPRCMRHNLIKNQGFTVHRDTQGHWHTHRPDGTEIY
ncbi:MAG: HNH endonuclease signature motif containing protein, partial [Ilumatobacteraceae bacterium]